MKEHEWYMLVYQIFQEHPEWMAKTINAIQEGVLKSHNDVLAQSANVEMGLVVMLENNKVSKDRKLVRKAVESMRTIKGSKAWNKWMEELNGGNYGHKKKSAT